MNIGQIFQTALRNLFSNRLRCLQAMLATVIGVAGVVVVLVTGNNFLKSVDFAEEQYSPSMIQMRVMTNTNLSKRISANDMEQLAIDRSDVIKYVCPYVLFENGGVRYAGNTDKQAFVQGVGEHYLDIVTGLQLENGRFLHSMDIEREQNVCVVGHYIADNLLSGEPLGKTLNVWGKNYTVVGVLQKNNNEDDTNEMVLIPYTNAKKMVSQNITPNYDYNCTYYRDFYFVDANGTENMYAAQTIVEEMIAQRMGVEQGESWLIGYMSAGFLNELLTASIYNVMFVLLFMAVIVLIVGGVGIMNVMLAAVQERTREIGIRKAFGATNKDIRWQFTLEAVLTSLTGGMVGVIFGVAGSYLTYNCVGRVPMGSGVTIQPTVDFVNIPVWSVLLALGVCIGVGVVFGTYPAQQAAKMEIVDAINSD